MAVTRTNYCPYPSFELGATLATGWFVSNSNTASLPTPTLVAGRTGGLAQRWTYTGVAADSGVAANLSLNLPGGSWSGAEAFTLSVYMKKAAQVGCNVGMQVFAQSWDSLAQEYKTLTADWARYSVSGIGLAGTTTLYLYLSVDGIHENDTFDITYDDLLIEKAADASTYFDGSTPFAKWTGPANASTSIYDPGPQVAKMLTLGVG